MKNNNDSYNLANKMNEEKIKNMKTTLSNLKYELEWQIDYVRRNKT